MNPVNFVEDLITAYNNSRQKPSLEEDYSKPVYTIDHMVSTLQRIKKIMLENTEYDIAMKKLDGTIQSVKLPYACRTTQLEEIIVFQPLIPMTMNDYEALQEGLVKLQDDGEFNDKCVFLLPPDIAIMRATVDYSTVYEEDKWKTSTDQKGSAKQLTYAELLNNAKQPYSKTVARTLRGQNPYNNFIDDDWDAVANVSTGDEAVFKHPKVSLPDMPKSELVYKPEAPIENVKIEFKLED